MARLLVVGREQRMGAARKWVIAVRRGTGSVIVRRAGERDAFEVERPDGSISANRITLKSDAMRFAGEIAGRAGCEVKDHARDYR